MYRQTVMFAGQDDTNSVGLWVTNGTETGTYEVTGISGADSGGLNPSDLTVFNGGVLFNGVDASGNDGLWSRTAPRPVRRTTGISGADSGLILD